jgi:hypothetical protein
MSLKHLLALAGLVAVAACQNPIENQPLCSGLDGIEPNYPCVADPIDQQFPVPLPDVPPPDVQPRAGEDM